MAQYMDDIYDNQRHWLQLDLKERPSVYMDRNVYASFIRDPIGVKNETCRVAAISCGPPTTALRDHLADSQKNLDSTSRSDREQMRRSSATTPSSSSASALDQDDRRR